MKVLFVHDCTRKCKYRSQLITSISPWDTVWLICHVARKESLAEYNWSKYAAQGLANMFAVLRLIAVVIMKQSSQYTVRALT